MSRTAALLFALLTPAACGDEANGGRPNVVLFLVDDLGARDLARYGSTLYETPHADALADRGVTFTRAYSAYPRCVPSRIGLLSGKYPARVQAAQFALERDDPARSPHALPLGEVTFGEAFREAGYQTAYMGKWHLGKEGGGPSDQGFDTVVHSGSAGATGSFFPPFPVEKGHAVAHPLTGEPGDDLTGRLTDAAVEYVETASAADAPFLLVLAHYDVHTPLEADDGAKKKYARKLRKAGVEKGGTREDPDLAEDRAAFSKTVQNNPTYAAMVERTDDSLGRLLAALDDAGVADDTVVVLTSDHGGLSTRGAGNRRALATSNAPLRQGKGSIFEGGTRVPLIVAGPGIEPATSAAPVHGVDLYPTLLDLAGLPPRPEQHVDGRSFAAAVRGEPVEPRGPLFWYKWQARPDSTGDTRAVSLVEGDLKLIEWLDETPVGGPFAGPPEGEGRVELFDLAADPGERTNLAGDRPAEAAAMLDRLRAIEEEVGNLRDRKSGRGKRGGDDD